MMLTALALLFASALFAGVVTLLDCALRARRAYLALTCERSGRRRDVQTVTVTQYVPGTLSAANSNATPAPLHAAA